MIRYNADDKCYEIISLKSKCLVRCFPEAAIDISDMYGINICKLLQTLVDLQEKSKKYGEYCYNLGIKSQQNLVKLTIELKGK